MSKCYCYAPMLDTNTPAICAKRRHVSARARERQRAQRPAIYGMKALLRHALATNEAQRGERRHKENSGGLLEDGISRHNSRQRQQARQH